MSTKNLTLNDFTSTVEGQGIVLIDFWAAWCGPCKMFAPTFETVSNENPEMVFAKVDTEAERELAAHLQIRSIPTLMIFRDGILLYRQAGALPPDALRDLVKQVKELDMAEVKKQIADQSATA